MFLVSNSHPLVGFKGSRKNVVFHDEEQLLRELFRILWRAAQHSLVFCGGMTSTWLIGGHLRSWLLTSKRFLAFNFTTCQCWTPLRLGYILAARQPLFITYQRAIWESLILKRYRPGAQQFDSLEELITDHGQQLHSTVLIVVQSSPLAREVGENSQCQPGFSPLLFGYKRCVRIMFCRPGQFHMSFVILMFARWCSLKIAWTLRNYERRPNSRCSHVFCMAVLPG